MEDIMETIAEKLGLEITKEELEENNALLPYRILKETEMQEEDGTKTIYLGRLSSLEIAHSDNSAIYGYAHVEKY